MHTLHVQNNLAKNDHEIPAIISTKHNSQLNQVTQSSPFACSSNRGKYIHSLHCHMLLKVLLCPCYNLIAIVVVNHHCN